jgi:hypothetical protein
VSERVIGYARAGLYSEKICATVSPERLQKFLETAIEKGTTSAAEKGTSRQSKREPPDAKYSAGWLTEVFFLQSTRQEGSTGAFNGRYRTNSQAGSC